MSKLYTIRGITYYVQKQRLKDVFPYVEQRANPVMWFGFDLDTRDVVVGGVSTERECIELLNSDANERRD